MKTQVIQLDRFDDAASVKDKMNWGQSERILLVWPGRHSPLDRELELALIERHSHAIGARIAIVSRNAQVVRAAHNRGVPTFRSVRDAQRQRWETAMLAHDPTPPKRPERAHALTEMRAWREAKTQSAARPVSKLWFALGVAAVLLVAALFAPGATVTITPQQDMQSLALILTADPALAQTTLSGGVPADTLTITVEGRESRTPSGSVAIPQTAATGVVTFTNLTDRELVIPAGAVVRTRDEPIVRFTTVSSATLPAAAGATVDVAIEAENPGSQGNVAAEAVAVIDGELGLNAAVSNPAAVTGGSDRVSGAPSQSDYTQLRAELLEALWQAALAEARGSTASGDWIITRMPEDLEVQLESFSPATPQPASVLELHMQISFPVLVMRAADVQAATAAILDANVDAGQAGVPNSLVITPDDDPSYQADGSVQWPVTAERTLTTDTDIAQLPVQLAGRNVDDAHAWLAEVFGADAVHIERWPANWPWLPWLPLRIQLVAEGLTP